MDEKKITFEECVLRSAPTGSRYICRPAPTDTDNDTVILVNGYYDWQSALIRDGWTPCEGQEAYQFAGRFHAFRKGIENYIVTEDEDFFKRYVFATEGAKALNLLKKEDRITMFQAIADSWEGIAGLPVDPREVFANHPRAVEAFGGEEIVNQAIWQEAPLFDLEAHPVAAAFAEAQVFRIGEVLPQVRAAQWNEAMQRWDHF